ESETVDALDGGSIAPFVIGLHDVALSDDDHSQCRDHHNDYAYQRPVCRFHGVSPFLGTTNLSWPVRTAAPNVPRTLQIGRDRTSVGHRRKRNRAINCSARLERIL